MAKVTVYLPDELAQELRTSGVNISAICQAALRSAMSEDPEGPYVHRAGPIRGQDVPTLAAKYVKEGWTILGAGPYPSGGGWWLMASHPTSQQPS